MPSVGVGQQHGVWQMLAQHVGIADWTTTAFPSAGISSITLTRKLGTAFGNARQMTSMPPRIGTTVSRPYGAYRPSAPSAQRASMPSTSWASYAVKNFWAVDT